VQIVWPAGGVCFTAPEEFLPRHSSGGPLSNRFRS
jgi:hypothetical protein